MLSQQNQNVKYIDLIINMPYMIPPGRYYHWGPSFVYRYYVPPGRYYHWGLTFVYRYFVPIGTFFIGNLFIVVCIKIYAWNTNVIYVPIVVK